MSRRFTPPTRNAFDKGGQSVIDDIYRIVNDLSGSAGGESRGAPATSPQQLVFSGITAAREFFEAINVNTLHSVATRTGSLTVDNILTMSAGAQIVGENYMIEENDIYIYSDQTSAPLYGLTTGFRFYAWDGSAQSPVGDMGSNYRTTSPDNSVGITTRTGVMLFLRAGQAAPVTLYPGWGIDILDDEISIMHDPAGKIGFFGASPVAQQAAPTAAVTGVTVAAGTFDYAFVITNTAGVYGLQSEDEMRGLIDAVANLQTRVGEIITALQNFGLLDI
jgi:hypothetical protein